jgi:hypothetical protein
MCIWFVLVLLTLVMLVRGLPFSVPLHRVTCNVYVFLLGLSLFGFCRSRTYMSAQKVSLWSQTRTSFMVPKIHWLCCYFIFLSQHLWSLIIHLSSCPFKWAASSRLSPPKSGVDQLRCLGSNHMHVTFIGELAGWPAIFFFYIFNY